MSRDNYLWSRYEGVSRVITFSVRNNADLYLCSLEYRLSHQEDKSVQHARKIRRLASAELFMQRQSMKL